eukprot:jgi/Mesvir1/21418/Mv25938-RA.1
MHGFGVSATQPCCRMARAPPPLVSGLLPTSLGTFAIPASVALSLGSCAVDSCAPVGCLLPMRWTPIGQESWLQEIRIMDNGSYLYYHAQVDEFER